MSQDPIGFSGGLNVYGFVEQDPINGVDIEGLVPLPIDAFGPYSDKVYNIGGSQIKVGLGSLKKGYIAPKELIAQANARANEMRKKGAILKSNAFEPEYNCYGATFSRDLGEKKWIENFQEILNTRYTPLKGKQKALINDIVIFGGVDPKDGSFHSVHSIRLIDIDSNGVGVYESKDVAGGLYHGNWEQVAKPYLEQGAQTQWYRPK